jgi:putative copper export protein
MLVKIIVVIFLAIIVYSLGSALYYLAHEQKDSEADANRVVKALTWRISLSLLLFILLFVAYGLGWIKPHGV